MQQDGLCHLCGTFGPLSYEHVPPSAAFNDRRVLECGIDKMIGGNLIDYLEKPHGRYNQKGSGRYTLCSYCNNNTGRWYAPAYINFARLLFPLCQSVPATGIVDLRCVIKPLNVLKQIFVMFCSASPPEFMRKRPNLIRYLLNPESREMGEILSVFMSLYDVSNSRMSRQAGVVGRIDMDGEAPKVYSEISFPPFNMVLALDGGPPAPNLFEISFFREFEYGQPAEVQLKLHNLAVNSYLPGDYRTFDELKALVEKKPSRQ